MKKKIGRNEPCTCGSGLKYKKCCLQNEKRNRDENNFESNKVESRHVPPFSSQFRLMPSFVWKGYRLRFIFNSVHYHHPNQTFHNFLLKSVLEMTFGKKWFNSQKGMAFENQHAVFKWFESTLKFRAEFSDRIREESTQYGKVYSCETDGPQQALLSLGWDLYCLQSKERLPTNILKKLLKKDDFQSFRYELAVAALMVRAGYSIKWYDISGNNGKRSEFVATHFLTKEKLTVEAKSLKRPGVLNEAGAEDIFDEKVRQIAQRLRDAEKKKESGIPHAVFIDINRSPDAAKGQSDLDYLKSLINVMPQISSDKPAKHEFLVLTNFSPYYGGIGEALPKFQNFPVIPIHSNDYRDPAFYGEIFNSLDHYGVVPEEI